MVSANWAVRTPTLGRSPSPSQKSNRWLTTWPTWSRDSPSLPSWISTRIVSTGWRHTGTIRCYLVTTTIRWGLKQWPCDLTEVMVYIWVGLWGWGGVLTRELSIINSSNLRSSFYLNEGAVWACEVMCKFSVIPNSKGKQIQHSITHFQ